MKPLNIVLLFAAVIGPYSPVIADDLADLKAEISQMKRDYEQRIQQLEQRIANAEIATNNVQTLATITPIKPSRTNNSFNPAISMVLNGKFSDYSKPFDDYELSGFALAGESGLAREGFSLGESEITLSANIDHLLFGQTTIALHDDGSTEIAIEEAFIETIGLDNGLIVRAGRFFSPIGYLNEKHIHAWNFADAPLIYRGLFGNQLTTDGVKLSYLLPTDLMFEIGGTMGGGGQHPSAGNHNGIGDWLMYARTGGDIDINQSWQVGVSHWQSSPEDREYSEGHNHGGSVADPVLFNGDTDISNISLIYKWAPNGNFRQKNISLLGEFFYLHEDGELSNSSELASYNGKQYGGFIEGIYQFSSQWRLGSRYDWLGSDLNASDTELLTDADLDFSGFHPQRYSIMLEWLPSEFSRLRAQVNVDKSSQTEDIQLFLQYTVNLGAHSAHSF